MGLHRDPGHGQPVFAVEMHRRIWNTILEINLQTSLLAGAPPSISSEEYNTKCPENYDDEQLLAENPVSRPIHDFTQVATAIALRNSFSIRLSIAKFLNSLGSSVTYEATLEHDTKLRASYKALRRTLQGYNSTVRPSPTNFEIRVVDLLMNYYLSCLHLPFLETAMHKAAYAFSRKVATETSLKIWFAVHPNITNTAAAAASSNGLSINRDDLARFAICGSGLFRVVAFQVVIILVVEMRSQIQEDEGMRPIPVRSDLLTVLNDAKVWSLRCIEVGETNIKGYVLISIVAAQIQGLVQGLGKEELPKILIAAAEKAEEVCLLVLQAKAVREQTEANATMFGPASSNSSPEVVEDWNFMKPDGLFFNDSDPMSWLFDVGNGNNTHEPYGEAK